MTIIESIDRLLDRHPDSKDGLGCATICWALEDRFEYNKTRQAILNGIDTNYYTCTNHMGFSRIRKAT